MKIDGDLISEFVDVRCLVWKALSTAIENDDATTTSIQPHIHVPGLFADSPELQAFAGGKEKDKANSAIPQNFASCFVRMEDAMRELRGEVMPDTIDSMERWLSQLVSATADFDKNSKTALVLEESFDAAASTWGL